MGIASLILGILALTVAWVPCVGVYAIVFSIVGLVLGAVAYPKAKKAGKGTGLALAGLICNIVATGLAIYWCVIMGAAATSAADSGLLDAAKEINNASQEISSGMKSLGL